jgi:predicted pyridoxine 5'-phosphate oxidase superfamily flavin-nucleotide-binding protein
VSIIQSVEQLEAIYGQPNEASTVKVADRITPRYQMLIDKSLFVALATWNPDKRVDPGSLPIPGQILAQMSENRVGGEEHDRAWPERAAASLW